MFLNSLFRLSTFEHLLSSQGFTWAVQNYPLFVISAMIAWMSARHSSHGEDRHNMLVQMIIAGLFVSVHYRNIWQRWNTIHRFSLSIRMNLTLRSLCCIQNREAEKSSRNFCAQDRVYSGFLGMSIAKCMRNGSWGNCWNVRVRRRRGGCFKFFIMLVQNAGSQVGASPTSKM